MNLRTHLNNQINFGFATCFVLFLYAGCSKQEKQEAYVAKVDNSVLTEEQLKSALSEDENKSRFRSEFINDWIETEILFKEAEKEGILKEDKFNSLLERSKKHLAAALFIEKVLEASKIEVNDEEIDAYYETNKNDFKFTEEAYKINIINFNDFDKAVSFRLALMESNWSKTFNTYNTEKSVLSSEAEKLIYKYQIQPVALLRIITNLQPNEISIVLETEPMKFSVVQLIEKYEKGSIPQLDLVLDEVKNRLLMIKKKELMRNYIDKLITDHNLEIVRYSE
jgi:hypothetical protein